MLITIFLTDNKVFDIHRNGSNGVKYIDMVCKNHPDGYSRANWDPYYHHNLNSFPPCIPSGMSHLQSPDLIFIRI